MKIHGDRSDKPSRREFTKLLTATFVAAKFSTTSATAQSHVPIIMPIFIESGSLKVSLGSSGPLVEDTCGASNPHRKKRYDATDKSSIRRVLVMRGEQCVLNEDFGGGFLGIGSKGKLDIFINWDGHSDFDTAPIRVFGNKFTIETDDDLIPDQGNYIHKDPDFKIMSVAVTRNGKAICKPIQFSSQDHCKIGMLKDRDKSSQPHTNFCKF